MEEKSSNFPRDDKAVAQQLQHLQYAQNTQSEEQRQLHGRKTKRNPPYLGVKLPSNFSPTRYSVICGRGASNRYNGNAWCRQLVVAGFARCHPSGMSRKDKTELVTDVVEKVNALKPVGGGFFRMDRLTGCWFEITKSQARRKVLEIIQEAFQEKLAKGSAADEDGNTDPFVASDRNSLDGYGSKESASMTQLREIVKQTDKLSCPTAVTAAAAEVEWIQQQTLPRSDTNHVMHQQIDGQIKIRQRDLSFCGLNESLRHVLPFHQVQEKQVVANSFDEDQRLQRFLCDYAKLLPDSIVETENPFEPKPLPG